MNRRILAIVAGFAMAFSGGLTAEEISMQIAPTVVNLESTVHKLTVHAEIDRSSVVDADLVLVLQGVGVIPVESVRGDYEGELVAEFTWETAALSAVDKAKLLDSGEANFQLSGKTFTEAVFEGEDEVLVLGRGGRN